MVQFLPATILLIGLLAGIWLNRRDYESLRRELTEKLDQVRTQLSSDMDRQFADVSRQFTDVNRQFAEVSRRLTLIESDQKQFFVVTGKMEGRIDEISRR